MSKTKFLILLTVFIDVIGLGIVIPILPFYVARFSDSAFLVTALFSVYALCSFFSAPVIGSLSDRLGRRPMLILSIFSTALGWFVFALAPNILVLFLGRIIDGIMAGNMPIAQGYLSDIAKDDKERTANLGLIGAVFGIGFILGPFLGGTLGHLGHTIPFYFVGALALCNGLLALFILPETHHNLSQHKISLNPFKPLFRAITQVSLRSNYLAWFLFGLAVASYHSVFSLYLRDVFKFDEFIGGMVFALMGVIISLNQGLAMKHIWLKYFKEPRLELITLFIFAVGFLFLSSNVLIIFCLALIVTTFGQSILRVVMTSQVVGQSDVTQRGESLGIMSAITSLSMMIGPVVAGLLYQIWMPTPFWFSSVCLFIAGFVLYWRKQELSRVALSEDVVMDSLI